MAKEYNIEGGSVLHLVRGGGGREGGAVMQAAAAPAFKPLQRWVLPAGTPEMLKTQAWRLAVAVQPFCG